MASLRRAGSPGGENPWRLTFYAPLLIYLAFAACMLVHTATTTEIRSASSRQKMLRRLSVIAIMFIAVWVFP